MKDKGLKIILEQNQIINYINNQVQSQDVQDMLSQLDVTIQESKNCAVCKNLVNSSTIYPLDDIDGNDVPDGASWGDIYLQGDKIEKTIKNLIKDDILFEVDSSMSEYKALTSSEEKRTKKACKTQNTLIDFIKDTNSNTDAIKQAAKWWKKICAKFKPKLKVITQPVNTGSTQNQGSGDPTIIYGCTDPTASNYWCDIDGNDCTGGIPANVRDGGCEYKQKIPLVYNYGFCNDSKGCDKINLDAGTHDITTLNKKSVKKMYNDYKEMLNGLIENDMVAGGRVFLPIENSDSFYGEPSEGDVKDLARALTIQAKNTCQDYVSFPYEYVTMYGADGITPLGQFKIEVSKSKEVSCTDRIESLTPWASRKTTRDRVISMLQNQTTVKLDLEKLERYQLTIDAINNLFSGWGMPVYASNDGVIKYTGNKEQTKVNNKKQSNTKETDFNPQQYQNLYNSIDGLSNVLLEEPQGLIKTLK
tara:strand:- start:636 stop:2060 length:1425 start_codon:yes stop_codon:yes gene_type:complete